MSITQQDIVAGIRALGVSPGDLLLVHSALSSFGHVEGGAVAVARALVESVSPGGTAFVPTFNYGQLPYDPATTPSLTGAITESFRTLAGAVRSRHPTHPVAGVGPDAEAIIAGHEDAHPFGPGSPLWRLWERNAWVLLIGCDHRASSMIHVAEEAVAVAYLDCARVATVLQPDGTAMPVTVRRPGCSTGFNTLDATLRARDAVREGTIAAAQLMLMRARDIVAAASDLLRGDQAALLCSDSACERCTQAREMIRRA